MIRNKNKLNSLKFLDGEVLFRKYFEEMGTARSFAKLVNFCVTQSQRNPKTGKPPTRMGVWKAMWSWALRPENINTAREIFNKAMRDEGEHYTDDEWKEFIFTKAKGGAELGKSRYEKLEEAVK